MSDEYECANCGMLSGQYGHYSFSAGSFTCKSKHVSEVPIEVPARCKECGMSGAHFCPGRPLRDERRWDLEREIDLSAFDELLKTVKCRSHPKYKALRRPRTACEACWRRWISLNPA